MGLAANFADNLGRTLSVGALLASASIVFSCKTAGQDPSADEMDVRVFAEGFDYQFCQPMVGYAENMLITLGGPSSQTDWRVSECSDGRSLTFAIRNNGVSVGSEEFDVLPEVLKIRAEAARQSKPFSLNEIAAKMRALGAKQAHEDPLTSEQIASFCPAEKRTDNCVDNDGTEHD